MISDSLTANPSPLPIENSSVFKKLIQSQDEVSNANSKGFYFEIQKDYKVGIKQKLFVDDRSLCTSMFYQKNITQIDFQPHSRHTFNTEWVFFTFMICLLFAGIYIYKNSNRISQLFKAFLVPHFTNQLIRDGNIIREFFIYPLLLVYLTSLYLLITFILSHFFNYDVGLAKGILIFLFLFFFFLFKIVGINIIGKVFQTSSETTEYLTNYIIFSVVFGMFLFPFVFFLIYITPTFSILLIYIILTILVLTNFYRTIRGLIIGLNSKRYNLYYLFLYLCTIEILPIGISVKLLITFYLTGDFLK